MNPSDKLSLIRALSKVGKHRYIINDNVNVF